MLYSLLCVVQSLQHHTPYICDASLYLCNNMLVRQPQLDKQSVSVDLAQEEEAASIWHVSQQLSGMMCPYLLQVLGELNPFKMQLLWRQQSCKSPRSSGSRVWQMLYCHTQHSFGQGQPSLQYCSEYCPCVWVCQHTVCHLKIETPMSVV